MRDAIDYARANGGKLLRQPGGFWVRPEDEYLAYCRSFGTPTVEGLVRRGVASYTKWKEGRNGRFPVEVVVTPLVSVTLPDNAITQ
jgi:hypothetical protein